MEISITKSESGPRLATIDGELDADNCGELGVAFLQDLDGVDSIAVDMSLVSFIDSSALSELLRVKAELTDADVTFVVSAVSEQVDRVLEITGLKQTFGLR